MGNIAETIVFEKLKADEEELWRYGPFDVGEDVFVDSTNLWNSNGVEDRLLILKELKKDSKIMKKIGPDPYWDDFDLVADNDNSCLFFRVLVEPNCTLNFLDSTILSSSSSLYNFFVSFLTFSLLYLLSNFLFFFEYIFLTDKFMSSSIIFKFSFI